MKHGFVLLLILMIPSSLGHADEPSTAAAQEYQALLEEFEQQGGARLFAKRFIAFAKEHPDDPSAIDALQWVIKKVRGRTDTDSALDLLQQNHLQSAKLKNACADIARSRSVKAEPLLRLLKNKSPHKAVQAHAAYFLAALLDLEANIVEQLSSQPKLAPRVMQYYGQEYGKHLSSLDSAKLERKCELAYEAILRNFPDAEVENNQLKEFADKKLFAIRNLSVGKVAPEIEGEDIGGKSFKLSDYRGKVVMLTFWGHW